MAGHQAARQRAGSESFPTTDMMNIFPMLRLNNWCQASGNLSRSHCAFRVFTSILSNAFDDSFRSMDFRSATVDVVSHCGSALQRDMCILFVKPSRRRNRICVLTLHACARTCWLLLMWRVREQPETVREEKILRSEKTL